MSAIRPIRLPMQAPDDLAAFEAMLDDGRIPPAQVVALWCKTRGNGLLNDFTKPWVDLLLRLALARRLGCDEAAIAERVPILVSGGAEGLVSPHLVVWLAGAPGAHGLACAVERALVNEPGGEAQAATTEAMLRSAMARLGSTDIGLVLVRAPAREGAEAATRIAAARGVAQVLGDAPDAARCTFVVARHDGPAQQMMVLANAPGGDPRFAIATAMLADPLDAPAAAGALAQLGLCAAPQIPDPTRIIAAISKGDAPRGALRGLPHAMWADNDIAMHRHARAAYGAMLGALIGHGAVLVSGGAEGQGAPDGGFVSFIASTGDSA